MTEEPSVRTASSGTCLSVQVGGPMDYRTAPFFHGRIGEEIARGRRDVVLDLSAVSFCDSAGLSVLIRAWRQADAVGAALVLARVPPYLVRMLQLTGLDTVLRVYDGVAEAEAGIGAGGT
ncbi:STAS domain-containing protein [Streptomyces sp. JW3]|uniref:STAS domain-containing protein n=1 Tax=Streptomyces sp. JW3 TaxID=3456955 RepID=UPI003FA48BA4